MDFDKDRPSRSFSYEEEVFFEDQKPYKEYPVPKTRQRVADPSKYYNSSTSNSNKENRIKSNPNDPRYYEPQKTKR